MSKAPTFKPILAPTTDTVKEETKEPSEEELFGTNHQQYCFHRAIRDTLHLRESSVLSGKCYRIGTVSYDQMYECTRLNI